MRFPDKWRFRVNFFGKVILQRGHRVVNNRFGDSHIEWRDATSTDISRFFREASCN